MATDLDLAGNLARSYLGRASSEYATTLRQLSSGRKADLSVGNPSEINIAARAGGRLAVLDAAVTNIDYSVAVLEAADEGLSIVEGLVERARSLALQATSASLGDIERSILDIEYQAILEEIDRLVDDTTVGDKRVLRTGITPVVIEDNFDNFAATAGSLSLTASERAGASSRPVTEGAWYSGGELLLTRVFDPNAVPPAQPPVFSATAAVVSRAAFPTFSGVTAEFQYFSGGTNSPLGGGDGVVFFFVDGEQYQNDRPPGSLDGGPGLAGGALGYSGIPFGFVGVGFDEFGNFANTTDNIVHMAGDTGLFSPNTRTQQSISVRAGAPESFGLMATTPSAPLGGNIDGGYRDVRITVDSSLILTVDIRFDGGSSFARAHEIDLRTFGLTSPETLKFGISSGTGGANNIHTIDNLSVSAGTDVFERIRLSASAETAGIVRSAKSAAGVTHVRDGSGHSSGQLSVGLLDATVAGLTLSGTGIDSEPASKFALRRLNFALEQLSQGRVIIGGQVERLKFARQEALTAIDGNSELFNLFGEVDVANGVGTAALQGVLVEIGIFALAEIDKLKDLESNQLLDIIA